ncbi:hypothetical protein FB45DRAFT_1057227 [Roridomyces roridus]|uniref:Uncharacterized protein n=1 Tax=Roridomyces roridus TaxID=1738132 RepID=A0AAD7FPG8_9AGAR|nr:hypothetical protein FB45DRAFT_1057227 [Roridomyces roridus]
MSDQYLARKGGRNTSMKFSATLLVLVSVGATALAAFPQISETPSSCMGTNNVVLQTRNFTTSTGDILRVESKACSAARSTGNSGHSKRQTVVDACVFDETVTFRCVTNVGAGPALADCNNLNAAIIQTFEAVGGKSSSRLTPNTYPACPLDVDLFTVAPDTFASFELGTCQYGWINENPTETLEFCFSQITGFLGPELINGCIINGDTAGVGTPSGAGIPADILEWSFQVVRQS